ncbi:hypothetical protein ACTFR8_23320 [Bacillus cereus group sp. MYBK15-3]|uniref:hypothetical protein n=1 Tax=Bacillus cereus group TaxID=86661 RepID=UPI001C8BAF2B|nr:hypothetical protein [Bacillus cereus]MBX9158530.1 hypothetical protein [Bacillus cereus]
MNNHSRVAKTVAEGVKLNLGGGAEATVNVCLNEEGFLLIDGLDMDSVEYEAYMHDNKKLEIQILAPSGFDEDEDM